MPENAAELASKTLSTHILEAILFHISNPPNMHITTAHAQASQRQTYLKERADVQRFMLNAIRVSKLWHVINISRRIQEAMFFPPPAHSDPSTSIYDIVDPDINPLLAYTFPNFFHDRGKNDAS
jgi:hypothetical protein